MPSSHVAIALTFLRVAFPASRRVSAVLTWGFLALAVVVVGPAASVVRAVPMGGLAAWGMVMRRSAQSLQLLSGVTLATVLISAWSAVNLGFALSASASFGIPTLGRVIANLLVTPLVAPLTLLGTGAAALVLPVRTITVLLVKTAMPLAAGLAAVAGWPLAEFPWP